MGSAAIDTYPINQITKSNRSRPPYLIGGAIHQNG